MKHLLNILIFLLQTTGVVFGWVGMEMIWEPLGWIYSGAAAFIYGHLLYRAMESEESEK
mgnify:CR=1 FL=1